jgi:hypothetical protein
MASFPQPKLGSSQTASSTRDSVFNTQYRSPARPTGGVVPFDKVPTTASSKPPGARQRGRQSRWREGRVGRVIKMRGRGHRSVPRACPTWCRRSIAPRRCGSRPARAPPEPGRPHRCPGLSARLALTQAQVRCQISEINSPDAHAAVVIRVLCLRQAALGN